MSDNHEMRWIPGVGRFTPTPTEVSKLIERAQQHPLGVEFLAGGAPDAVAAVFGVHAFLVDAARQRLAAPSPALAVELVRSAGAPAR
jgi:hypothetical protein